MNPLFSWRQELRGLIPRGFLRRDQAPDALFASDYPRFPQSQQITDGLARAGYRVAIRGDVAHVDGTLPKYEALLSALPCPDLSPTDETLFAWALAQRLLRSQAFIAPQHVFAIGQFMKRWEQKDPAALEDFSAYAALCQRQHQPLPPAAGRVILCFLEGA